MHHIMVTFEKCLQNSQCNNFRSTGRVSGPAVFKKPHRLTTGRFVPTRFRSLQRSSGGAPRPFRKLQEESGLRERHGRGGQRRGEENLTKDTPLEKGFGLPFVWYPLGGDCSVSLYKAPSEPRLFWREGSNSFGGWYVSYPHTFCTPPPYHGRKNKTNS